MQCVVNPVVGNENLLAENLIVKTDTPRKIVIVGGGPAGLEAARIAATCGHQVVLFEAQSNLGGAINIAKLAPNAAQIGDIVLWLEAEVYRLGVDVRLSTFAEADEILSESPDSVIVATGSIPRMDGVQAAIPGVPLPGMAQSHVYSSHDIYHVSIPTLGKAALVFDDVGHFEALGIAEYLVQQGLAVTFVTRFGSIAPDMEAIFRLEPILRRLRQGDFRYVVRARIDEIGRGECKIGWLEGDQIETVPIDTVVMVTNNVANADTYHDLNGASRRLGFALEIIGDAASPRDLQVAIREGHMMGRNT